MNDIGIPLGSVPFITIGFVPFVIGLILYLISLFGNSIQERWRTKKATKEKKTFSWLVPFRDCLVNIEAGEYNHIFIMNTFFQSQIDNIVRIRTEIKESKISKVNTAWNQYEKWYNATAKGQIHSLFGAPEKEGLDILKKRITDIMKEIKKLKA